MANNESENNSNTPEPPVISQSNVEALIPAVPRVRRTKPMVEGINAPVKPTQASVPTSTPSQTLAGETLPGSTVLPPKVTLTDPEMQLIDDSAMPAASVKLKPGNFGMAQKIELPSQKRKFPWNRLIWAILISLLAVSAVLGILFWYDNRSGQDQSQFFGLFPKSNDIGNGGNNQITPAPVINPPTQEATNTPIISPISTSTPPAATGTLPSTITQIKITATPTAFLNVRSGPSLNDKILTKVHPGELYTYSEVTDNWYRITLRDGSFGWVFGQYVEVIR